VKILWIKPVLPYPPSQGTRRVTLDLLDALCGEHEITFVTRLLERSEAKWIPEVERRCRRVLADLTPSRRSPAHRAVYKGLAVAASLRGVPPRSFYSLTPALRRHVRALAPEADLTLVEYWYLGDLAGHIPAGRRVLLAHDADRVVFERALRAARTPAKRLRAAWRARRETAAEERAWGRFDTILTLTMEDRETVESAFAGRTGPRVEVLPIPVDTERLAPRTASHREQVVAFVGTFAADFNVDAVRYLAREIFPRVRREIPSARLLVAGGGAPAAVRALAGDPGVELLGHVEDLPGLVAGARAFVVPLRFGGGIRIRILEAMAMAAPIVTSRVGLGSIPLTHGVNCLIADGAEETAEAITRLLLDEECGARLGQAARELALRDYGRDRVAVKVRELFRSLRPGGAGRSGEGR
jgi:glycosyltransferase involved in cell wall biosynthesis